MRRLLTAVFLYTFLIGAAMASPAPKVVVSIKPLHGLVSAIMGQLATPVLLLAGNSSPHQTTLSPSMVRQTQGADIVFWVGHEFEPYMDRLLNSIGQGVQSVSMQQTPDLHILPAREGGNFVNDKEGHKDEHGHSDLHFWLSIDNAILMSRYIAQRLSKMDAPNAYIYQANTEELITNLTALKQDIIADLTPLKDKPFYVFHDAYQYFEYDFSLKVIGSIAVDPDRQPGAKRIRDIRRKIKSSNVSCLFREPQFTSKFVDTIAEGLAIKIAVLDPVGSDIPPGPDSYQKIIRQMADAIKACL